VFDLWIRSATLVDGTGAQPRRASVGVRDGRIAEIEPASGDPEPDARVTLDATGMVLAPGSIDVHNHSDVAPLIDPTMPSTIRQGVTTVVVGNCGMSPLPASTAAELASWVGGDHDPSVEDLTFDSFGAFLERIAEARPAVHIAALIGHGSVRELAMGQARRAPSPDELEAMRRAVSEAMDAGAVGLSTGLIYAPGMYADTAEIVALAEEAARAGGIYASHIRGEGAHLFRAVDEAVEIGNRANVPVHISHLKCESSHAWGRADELLERLHSAGATGDQYPYAAWSSVLRSLLPPWAPPDELPRLLDDPAQARRLVAAVEHGEEEEFQSSIDGVGWDRIVIEATSDPALDGLDVATIARQRGIEPVVACLELLIADPETTCTGHAMQEADVRTIRADPEIMVASDAVSTAPGDGKTASPVHPRTYGTFPRVLGPMVRDGTITLPAAVRAMTSLPADRFGLSGRGRISTGAWADLVLFDPSTITDRSTYQHPHVFPDGVEAVVVEGRIAWRRESDSIERAGRVLRSGRAAA
jgi:N-acyl-D-aspartate/D-glutamate deacylase